MVNRILPIVLALLLVLSACTVPGGQPPIKTPSATPVDTVPPSGRHPRVATYRHASSANGYRSPANRRSQRFGTRGPGSGCRCNCGQGA